jgi:radical SAM superfamily enzyme YgiQ (UPF0313 family)
MRVLLISTYDLGRQPFGLASPAAWLREAGFDVIQTDLSRERLDRAVVTSAGLIALHLPMHTATRLALRVLDGISAAGTAAHLCAYGLYAPLNADALRARGVQTILGGEFEEDLVALARSIGNATPPPGSGPPHGSGATRRLAFRAPDREGLPPLARYATLTLPGGDRRVVGYTEASRGCKHLCRHCPVVPVYQGAFRVVQVDVVVEDVRRQVEQGAQHITFGDPDFLNGPAHALKVVEAVARACPGVTYDVTVKVEHLLAHARLLRDLARTGCLFVTSAVESFDDRVLQRLRKGHARADVERAVDACRDAGLTLQPSFVAFTPWTTLDGYIDLLGEIGRLDLVEHVPSIQLAIRLLVPSGSLLLEDEEVRAVLGPFDGAALVYPWRHPDPRVDALQAAVERFVAARAKRARVEVFEGVWRLAHEHAGRVPPEFAHARQRVEVPYLDEPWYC